MNGLVNVHLNDLVNVHLSDLVNGHLNVYLITQLNGHDDAKARLNTHRNTPQYVALFFTTLAFHSHGDFGPPDILFRRVCCTAIFSFQTNICELFG